MNGTIICNPTARRLAGEAGLEGAAAVFKDAGWKLSVQYTQRPGDATVMAREAAAAGLDTAIVAGGDGMLHEAVQGLAHTDTALGFLPYGTVNVWARELGIPLEPERAALAMTQGRIERVDLGVADHQYFLLMAGLGFDAEVVRRTEQLVHRKPRLGVLLYAMVGLSTAPLYRGADVELRYEGVIRRVQALMLVVGNTRLHGGRFYFTPNAVANDGWLDLCIVKGHGFLSMARQSLPVLVSGSTTLADVETIRVKELIVQANEPVPMQLDGEAAGTTPIRFGVAPRALSAIVPQEFASNLIA